MESKKQKADRLLQAEHIYRHEQELVNRYEDDLFWLQEAGGYNARKAETLKRIEADRARLVSDGFLPKQIVDRGIGG